MSLSTTLFLLKFIVLAIVLTFVFGCASSATDQPLNALATSPAPTATSLPDPASTTNSDSPSACGPPERDALQTRISAQLFAFGREDFQGARDQASSKFKATFDTRGFEEMIRTGFPYLLSQSSVAFGRCRLSGETASLEVRFTAGTTAALVYFFLRERGQWWIDGASPAAGPVTNESTTS